MNDPFNLQRFVDAQNPVYDSVCAELRNGRKQTHWMWFIFPQIRGLGLVEGRSVENIFGYPDHLKFRSSMTLFRMAAPDNPVFQDALEKYFGGEPDSRTSDIVEKANS